MMKHNTARQRRPLWAYCAQMAAVVMFFLLAGIISLSLQVAGKFKKSSARDAQHALRKIFRIYLWWIRITGVLRLEVRGLEVLDGVRGAIIVSNHPALLDAILLGATLPPVACVMRANLLKNPLLRGSALAAGYITNDSGPAFVRQGIAKIHSGETLLIFPEGTRTIAPPVNRFKHGFALVAMQSSAPVYTVVIEYAGTHLTKGNSLLTVADIPLQFTIRMGKVFHADAGESASDFGRRIEAWFHEALGTSLA